MQLLQTPDVWTASAFIDAEPDDVLDLLTDPDRIAAWAPVGFVVDGLDDDRLTPGSRARVRGTLAGVGATFDVEVLRADDERLELVACGPIAFDVRYDLTEHEDGVAVDAQVSLRRGGGLTARLLQGATAGLLGRGALDSALQRLERALPCRELLAA